MILNPLEWHLTFPREVKDLLDMVLMYHLFKNAECKTLMWFSFGLYGRKEIKE